jgi:hypothetical protein
VRLSNKGVVLNWLFRIVNGIKEKNKRLYLKTKGTNEISFLRLQEKEIVVRNSRKVCIKGLADTLNLETFDGVISDDVELQTRPSFL